MGKSSGEELVAADCIITTMKKRGINVCYCSAVPIHNPSHLVNFPTSINEDNSP